MAIKVGLLRVFLCIEFLISQPISALESTFTRRRRHYLPLFSDPRNATHSRILGELVYTNNAWRCAVQPPPFPSNTTFQGLNPPRSRANQSQNTVAERFTGVETPAEALKQREPSAWWPSPIF